MLYLYASGNGQRGASRDGCRTDFPLKKIEPREKFTTATMGKAQKKHGKGRLDHYYRLAKEKGYRARSSFKILQINQKFGNFLSRSKVVIDLCAAPGSWCQVASAACPVNALIIGVDLAPIKPLPNVITFQSDITTEHCRSQLRGHLKTWKADTVLHDGAPNVGQAWTQDAFTQSELVLQSLRLAVEFLVKGGTFVTKVFRSKDYNKLMWLFQQLFEKTEATKPPSSRNVSAEIFVVCQGYKAPKKVDPRLLDAKYVFEELADPTPNFEAKVFNPDKKKKNRDGYEEGDYTQHKTMELLEFVKSETPIDCLGACAEFTFDKSDAEFKQLRKLTQTTPDLLECFKDLKVLGKKDFRRILKWRKAARDLMGLDKKEEDTDKKEEEEEVDEDTKIERELKQLTEQERLRRKRERRHANEKKQKEITRMQMNMTTPMDIGLDASGQQGQAFFSLKNAEKTGKLSQLAKGKRSMVFRDNDDGDIDLGDAPEDEDDSDADGDQLEGQMNDMYGLYKERLAEQDAKVRAKMARGGDEDDEWHGFDAKSDTDVAMEQSDSDSDLDSDEDEELNKLITDLQVQRDKKNLSRRAEMFFNDGIFSQIGDASSSESPVSTAPIPTDKSSSQSSVAPVRNGGAATSESDDDFEVVSRNESDTEDSDNDWDADTKPKQPVVDMVTAQAMTLAHQLATGQKTKHSLIDEGFNRYSFRDRDGLPDWFLEDEERHSKISRPITKEAADAIKAKLKAMNARPIKKVAEAQARKKYKAAQKLEKLKKKSDLINDDESKSERDKAEDIAKLQRRLLKKQNQKPKITLIPAKGANRGLQGRPKGVKGRYKMVDGTMKKEQRALRRIEKKRKR